jgi:hypothetical protein
MSTYKAEMLPSESMYEKCPNSGVVMAKDGIATFRATGAVLLQKMVVLNLEVVVISKQLHLP